MSSQAVRHAAVGSDAGTIHSAAGIEQYWAPTTLDEALSHLAGGNVTVLAGGTDLMPQSAAGKVEFGQGLLNIRRIDALLGVRDDGDEIRIGALTTVSALAAVPLVRERLDILVQACDKFASEQLRNAATVGGNICNASPAGDLLVPLLVLGAEVELASRPNGGMAVRRLPMAEFFRGPGRTAREPHELLTAVCFPRPPEDLLGRFEKFGTRPALDIATISIGLTGLRRGRTLTGVRVAFGAVAPTPILAPRTAAAIEGAVLDESAIERAATVARDEVRPIDDVRASAWYRRELVHNLTARMLRDVVQ